MHEIKNIRDEDGPRCNHFPVLNRRYARLGLLGKGSFREVYKAYDLVEYSGKYIDAVLNVTPVVSEEEARIIVQIFSRLVYLRKRPHTIIH
jgi:hypothetical protein